MSLDPLGTAEHIRSAYLRYLRTAFPFNDPSLGSQFAELLRDPRKLVKGPYLEATPPFQPDASLEDLVEQGLLSSGFQKLCGDHFPYKRPLYAHQVLAIRKAIGLRRNLVAATGTGSGKTESFLVPILNHLLRQQEHDKLGPGVRALLLYPMNALANDQLKRMRAILAACPGITFGRYTGETEERARDAEKQFRLNHPGQEPVPNELLSREEMWETPPHILLTNYAMLEYLLLRPRDCEFFDGEQACDWRFVVLDEVHTYNGAVGIEMAMLLRRLRDRVVQSEPRRLQCIATSATLGRGRKDSGAVVRFAERLFDEPFEWVDDDENRQDVVEAVRVPVAAFGRPWGEPDPQLYESLRAAINSKKALTSNALTEIAKRHKVPINVAMAAATAFGSAAASERVPAFLHSLLQGDARLHSIRAQLLERPLLLKSLATSVIGPDKEEQLAALVDLAVRARPEEEDLPLLPARYHLFVRALEGAYVCLDPTPRLFLDRTERTEIKGDMRPVFEAATCRRCGQLYLVGRVQEGMAESAESPTRRLLHPRTLSEEIRGDDTRFFRVLGSNESAEDRGDEDEDVAAGESTDAGECWRLCACCGAIGQEGELFESCRCSGGENQVWRLQGVPSRGRQVNHCPACGSRSPGLVQRFLTGQDAPASVLATALYQDIPPARHERMQSGDRPRDEWDTGTERSAEATIPGEGRKLLAFSDSRQDAAFFACYLDRTYQQILRRRLIVQTLEAHPEAVRDRWRIQDLVQPIRQVAESCNLFSPQFGARERENDVWKWLLLELLAYDRRHSLEGLGILAFEPVRPQKWQVPPPLRKPPWGLSDDEAWSLYRILLDSFRLQGAITFPDGVSPDDEVFAPRNRQYFFRNNGASPKRGIFSWSSPSSRKENRRLNFLRRLCRPITGVEGDDRQLCEVISKIWERQLTDDGSPFREYFQPQSLPDEGVVYRMCHQFFQVAGFREDAWFKCDRCGGLSRVNLRGVCPTYRCDGTLKAHDPTASFQTNHYAQLALGIKPIRMVVEEHTAQLTSDAAARLQERFVRGAVNVLSCSTTFELGVDVGELEAVLLRNVPPETANYVQRAGRAGRRTDSTAFSLTFCQRRSHDLAYFQEPERMIAGRIHPPHFDLHNEKIIRRHAHAVALSWFFRKEPDCYGSVQSFFFASARSENGPAKLEALLRERPAELHTSLERIIPKELQNENELHLAGWSWADDLFDAKARSLRQAEVLVRQDVEQLEQVRKQLFEAGKNVDHLRRAINTIKQKDLIGFLANHNVLPKYGFPVDVVELDLLHHGVEAQNLELQRDLRIAIAEYAPESEVVAGGRLWVSRGLKRLPNLEWPKYNYAVCDQCGRYHRTLYETGQKPEACSCGASLADAKRRGKFLTPIFGFITDRDEPKRPKETRPDRTYASRVFFATEGYPADEPYPFSGGGVQLRGQFSRSGKLAVVNWSKFAVCEFCGFATLPSSVLPGEHRKPWTTDVKCKGTLQHWDLGHEFMTDLFDLRVDGWNAGLAFWQSLLYALLEGASDVLNIRRQDLDGCLYPYAGATAAAAPALVLYDDVPGGAGHVRRVGQNLEAVLRAARDRVDGRCGCGGGPDGPGETSCYGCLRNYRNQWAHEQLSRGPILAFLKSLVS